MALDYRINDDVMVYGSVAKGTKPAGFGTSQFATPQNARVDQEKLWAYELGAKTAWLDGSLQANVAIFYNDYTDRQVGVTVTDPNTGWPAAGIVNAAEAETKGVELELIWRATEDLTLGAGYAYTDAEWTDFNYSEIRADSGGVNEKDMAICGIPPMSTPSGTSMPSSVSRRTSGWSRSMPPTCSTMTPCAGPRATRTFVTACMVVASVASPATRPYLPGCRRRA